ncbi:hypothetical protein ABL78_4822 [Leptomonas seymouri]|uniref:protein-serine/threonine phosphatase n=1 Tax=Leptomonas seymouri TaxID=5684 RepID=A0A0N1I5U9_LEPSE|nr:hypothetical protein ABL78_4822 [Leptomonas seymouri]|eukprot:KPI86130.1 hypothetical protein ABL78_4822 [Leptomonas seymouri]
MKPTVSLSASIVRNPHDDKASVTTSPMRRSSERSRAHEAGAALSLPPLRLLRDASTAFRQELLSVPASSGASGQNTPTEAARAALPEAAAFLGLHVHCPKEVPHYEDREGPMLGSTGSFPPGPAPHAGREDGDGSRRHGEGCEPHRRSEACSMPVRAENTPFLQEAPASKTFTFHETKKAASCPMGFPAMMLTTSTVSADGADCRGEGSEAAQTMRRGGPSPEVAQSLTTTHSSSWGTRESASASCGFTADLLEVPCAVRSCGAPRVTAPAVAAASRALFLHDAEDDSSRDYRQPNLQISMGGGSSGVGRSSQHLQGSHGGSLSSRSSPGVSSATAIPEAVRTESSLLELLTRASSTDRAGISVVESEAGAGEGTEPKSWLRTPLNAYRKGGSVSAIPVTAAVQAPGSVLEEGSCDGKRSAQCSLPQVPSLPPQASCSERALPCAYDADAEHDAHISFGELRGEREDAEQPPRRLQRRQQQQSISNTLSSSCEALRFPFSSLTLKLPAADPPVGHTSASGRWMSRSVSRSLFSDAYAGSSEQLEPDALSIAPAVVADSRDGSAPTSPEEELGFSGFQTPISPCPSSVAPPFFVFTCAASSCGTSPVSIPAKMIQQRQRELTRASKGSISPVSQMPVGGGGCGVNSGSCNNESHSGSSGVRVLNSSQRGLRESLGSWATTSVTTGALPSASASAPDSDSHGPAGCYSFPDRSCLGMAAAGGKDGSRSSLLLLGGADDGQQREGEEWEAGDGRALHPSHRGPTAASLQHVDPQPEGEANSCFTTQPAAGVAVPVAAPVAPLAHTWMTATPLSTSVAESPSARVLAAVPLAMSPSTTGTSTPPLRSRRPTPCDASFPSVPPVADPRGAHSSLRVPSSPAEVPPWTVAARQRCCAMPWSPTSTLSACCMNDKTRTPPASLQANHSARGDDTETAWGPRLGGRVSTHGTRSCSLPLPLTPASEPALCFSLPSQVHDSGARTPMTEEHLSSESTNFISRTSREDANRRSGRPASTPSTTAGLGRHDNENFIYVERISCSSEPVRLGYCNIAAATQAAGAAAAEADTTVGCPSTQHADPHRRLISPVECEPLTFASQHARRSAPPPDHISTCSTPPPAALQSGLTSRCSSPCGSLLAMHGHHHRRHAEWCVDSAAFAVLQDRSGGASSAHCSSPLHDPAATLQASLHTNAAKTSGAATRLNLRMSRQALPPRQGVRLSLPSTPSPRASFGGSPVVPALAATASTVARTTAEASVSSLWSLLSHRSPTNANTASAVANTDATGNRAGCGLQPAQQISPTLPAGLSGVEGFPHKRDVREGAVATPAFDWPVRRIGSADSCGSSHEQIGFCADTMLSEAEDQCETAAAHDWQSTEDEPKVAMIFTQGHAHGVMGSGGCDDFLKSSTQFASSFQLVPPPPLEALPRSSSATTSVLSLCSPTGSPAGRQSRRGMRLPCLDYESSDDAGAPLRHQQIEGDTPLCEELGGAGAFAGLRDAVALPTEAFATREARLPASGFHYAFSSLHGARSRQEDSVTLTPDLLICEGGRRKERRTAGDGGAVTKANHRVERDAAREPPLADSSKYGEMHRTCCSTPDVHAEPAAFTCLGVFDGHCGDVVSSLASRYFPEHFEFAVKEYWAQWLEDRKVAAALGRQQDASTTAAGRSLPPSSGADGGGTSHSASTGMTSGNIAAPNEFQRVISAALVQSLVHLDLTLYDALHQKAGKRSATLHRDAGSTASVAAFFKVPRLDICSHRGSPCSSPTGARRNAGESQLDQVDEVGEDQSSGDGDSPTLDTYRLCIANLGDSRTIIGNIHTQQLLLATTDHRISACPSEEARIAAVGGVVEMGRVDGSLDVTRGLGDYRYKVDPTQWWAAAAHSSPIKSAGVRRTTAPTRSESKGLIASSAVAVASQPTSTPSASIVADAPHTEVASAVRALRWQSGSSTPVCGRFEGDEESNDTSAERRAASADKGDNPIDEGDNGDTGNELNAEVQRAGQRAEDGKGESMVQRRNLDQWRQSIANSSASAGAGLPARPAACFDVERNTERKLFTGTTATAATSSTPYQALLDPSRASSSPIPGSPVQPAAALTGNAVSNIADVYEWEVHRDDVLIIASDGVWDRMTSEEVLSFVCRELQELEAEREMDLALPLPVAAAASFGRGAFTQQTSAAVGDSGPGHFTQAASTRSFSMSPASTSTESSKSTLGQVATADVASQMDLQCTPLRQPTAVSHEKALCTPFWGGGGGGNLEETPGGVDRGSALRSSVVQTAAQHLTEHVVNNLSGNDNTTAIVVVFR